MPILRGSASTISSAGCTDPSFASFTTQAPGESLGLFQLNEGHVTVEVDASSIMGIYNLLAGTLTVTTIHGHQEGSFGRLAG
jgi:hypothetical protein